MPEKKERLDLEPVAELGQTPEIDESVRIKQTLSDSPSTPAEMALTDVAGIEEGASDSILLPAASSAASSELDSSVEFAVTESVVLPTARQRLYARGVFYPTLAWNYTLGRVLRVRRWWDYIDDGVIVGAYPFARDVPRLSAEGIKAVVNTCEEYPGPLVAYETFGIDQFWMPTTDFTHPQLQDVTRAVEFVQQHVQRGDKVYIHCKAGRARSATVALCWLMKYRALSAAEGQAKLLMARPHINRRLTQRPVVQQFEKQLRAAGWSPEDQQDISETLIESD